MTRTTLLPQRVTMKLFAKRLPATSQFIVWLPISGNGRMACTGVHEPRLVASSYFCVASLLNRLMYRVVLYSENKAVVESMSLTGTVPFSSPPHTSERQFYCPFQSIFLHIFCCFYGSPVTVRF
eukprot:TRINITY_DN33548_c0_g1_i1.p1 TRINITY_DN33548_c0_g1~~TRINITY_DN33548_c0_g1_i1.p1  ORF type:complete len:124 (+),score=1.47 TRINITY_DN33548_c0_g1_i1:90-461(+)